MGKNLVGKRRLSKNLDKEKSSLKPRSNGKLYSFKEKTERSVIKTIADNVALLRQQDGWC